MPRKYSPEVRRQVVELARAGTKVSQLAATFGMTDATIYNWLKQEKIDRVASSLARVLTRRWSLLRRDAGSRSSRPSSRSRGR